MMRRLDELYLVRLSAPIVHSGRTRSWRAGTAIS